MLSGGGVYADTTKLTTCAKQIIKMARQEVSEIEACPDCYAHARNLPRPVPAWFTEPCRHPHPLVWAKLKGFPFWPAKAMPRLNAQGFVDVRFFGQHDRAWVPVKDLYLYSKEPPTALPKKRKHELDNCVDEVAKHCKRLEDAFGEFKFAPFKTPYNPQDSTQIKLLLPKYDSGDGNFNAAFTLRVSTPAPIERSATPVPPKKKPIQKKQTPGKKSLDNNTTSTNSAPDSPSDDTEEANSRKSLLRRSTISASKETANAQSNNKSEGHGKLGENLESTKRESADDSCERMTNGIKKLRGDPENSPFLRVSRSLSTPRENPSESPIKSTNESDGSARSNSATQKSNVVLSKPKIVNNTTTQIYKPKTRLVDKMNAEMQKKANSESFSNDRESPSKPVGSNNSLNASPILSNSSSVDSIKITHNDSTIITEPLITTRSLPGEQTMYSILKPQNNVKSSIKDDQKEQLVLHLSQRKARKSFPNRPSAGVQSQNPAVGMPMANGGAYQLPPPEAGPLSSHVYNASQELARRMGQMIEDAISMSNDPSTTIHQLQLQIERLKWEHQQELAELRHATGSYNFYFCIFSKKFIFAFCYIEETVCYNNRCIKFYLQIKL